MGDEATLNGLLSRIALQDRDALRELYLAAAGRMLAVAQRLLDDRGAAEDVVQETFVAVWTRAGQFPALRTSPLAWLTAITRNRAIDLLRRRRPETPLQWVDDEGVERSHDAVDGGGTPVDRLLAIEADGRLAECLGRLEVEPRQALALAYYEGLTHEEVAVRLRRPLGTVKAWVRRSLLRLKECLGDFA